jgi:hypothetical protein
VRRPDEEPLLPEDEPELFGAEPLPEGFDMLPRGDEPLEPEGRETDPAFSFEDGLELLRTDDRVFPEGFCEVVVVFLRTVEFAPP